MRATVFFAPKAWASMQAVMLRLSRRVTPTKRSAEATPASFSVLMLVGDEQRAMMS